MSEMFSLAIEFKKCEREDTKLCLSRLSKGNCLSTLKDCQYPLMINPLCLCSNIEDCIHSYNIETYRGKTYIFYSCQNKCRFFIQDLESAIEKILKPLNSEYIYYGTDLDKLVKKVYKKGKPTNEMSRTIEFFDKVFKNLNFRSGYVSITHRNLSNTFLSTYHDVIYRYDVSNYNELLDTAIVSGEGRNSNGERAIFILQRTSSGRKRILLGYLTDSGIHDLMSKDVTSKVGLIHRDSIDGRVDIDTSFLPPSIEVLMAFTVSKTISWGNLHLETAILRWDKNLILVQPSLSATYNRNGNNIIQLGTDNSLIPLFKMLAKVLSLSTSLRELTISEITAGTEVNPVEEDRPEQHEEEPEAQPVAVEDNSQSYFYIPNWGDTTITDSSTSSRRGRRTNSEEPSIDWEGEG